MKDTFAYLLSLSSLIGLITNFPKWDRVCIVICIIAYCGTSIYEKFKK